MSAKSIIKELKARVLFLFAYCKFNIVTFLILLTQLTVDLQLICLLFYTKIALKLFAVVAMNNMV